VYKQPKDAQKHQLKQQVVKALVDQQRKILPRIGTRKLYYLIQEELKLKAIKFGRDKLFSLMRQYQLLIQPKRRYIQTTMSKHWMRKWPNLLKEINAQRPNEVWVSDITYLKTEQGNCYLNMVTDLYSRKIVGYAVAPNMETQSMIEALKMANKQRLNKDRKVIHHSDRGLQYCSNEYREYTSVNNIQLSMTEQSDPYENALAERMNRTLKEEFGLDKIIKNRSLVHQLVEESISLYNTKRPHLALMMKTPDEVHSKQKSRFHN
jgi:transposase InsO family protein